MNKYKQATEELYNQQKEKLEETKSKSSLRAILKKDLHRQEKGKSEENCDHRKAKKKQNSSSSEDGFNAHPNQPTNPFKGVCTPEMAAEWLKMNIMAYPPIFPAMQMYQSIPYRGGGAFRSNRGRFRGRGRGSFHSHYEDDGSYNNGYRSRWTRSRSRSISRSRSKSRLVNYFT